MDAVSIDDHSYWLALACVAFEWKPVLRNVFCLRRLMLLRLLRLLRFLRTFLALHALRALRLDGNRASATALRCWADEIYVRRLRGDSQILRR